MCKEISKKQARLRLKKSFRNKDEFSPMYFTEK